MKDGTARNIAIVAVAAFLIVMAVMLTNTWGVAKPVHAAFGWTVDSIYWVHIIDSVRTDSSGKLYSVTEWPDTNFDLSLGHIHQVRFIYWAPGLDSANWQFDFDMYDYNNANCVGGGSYVASIIVYDSANDEAVQNAQVTIKEDSSLGPTFVWWMTNASGLAEFALNNGDWTAVVGKPRFMSSPLDFSIASGSYSDTIFGYQVSTPAPPSLDYATVEGYVWGIDGKKFYGAKVRAHRTSGEYATDTSDTPVIIVKDVAVVVVDTSGYFSMSLLRTSVYDDTTSGFYNFVCESVAGVTLFSLPTVHIPASGDVDLGLVAGRR